jgi:hypothetical protein
MTREELIKEYQCPGCIGCDKFEDQGDAGSGCMNHHAATIVYPTVGKIFLGMPKGFDRLGAVERMPLNIFLSYDDMVNQEMIVDDLNVPVWKYLDKNGNTLIRGFRPRINDPFLFVIGGDCRDKFDCLEITEEHLEKMD